jgi:hypothetical protein
MELAMHDLDPPPALHAAPRPPGAKPIAASTEMPSHDSSRGLG